MFYVLRLEVECPVRLSNGIWHLSFILILINNFEISSLHLFLQKVICNSLFCNNTERANRDQRFLNRIQFSE